jgi:hypothetical protein
VDKRGEKEVAKQYIEDLTNLMLRFKKKHERWESDCAMTDLVLALYEEGGATRRKRIIRWALKMLASEKVSVLAKQKMLPFLCGVREDFSGKQYRRFLERIDVAEQTDRKTVRRTPR